MIHVLENVDIVSINCYEMSGHIPLTDLLKHQINSDQKDLRI
jgi:hypothetical protein